MTISESAAPPFVMKKPSVELPLLKYLVAARRSHLISLLGVLVVVMATTSQAATFCVTDGTDLDAALQAAESNGEDDVVKLVSGSFTPVSPSLFYFAEAGHSVVIEGGYDLGCAQRDDDASVTAIDGGGMRTLLRIDAFPGSGDITVRNLTLRDGLSVGGQSAVQLLGAGTNTVTLESAILRSNVGAVFQSQYYFPAVWLAADQGNIVVRNVLFANNDAASGIAPVWLLSSQGGNVTFNNNTVVANGATSGVEATEFDFYSGGTLSLANNILWGNVSGDIREAGNGESIELDHNDIGVRTMDTPTLEFGTLNTDPKFVSPSDYRLDPNSPLRDAGDSTAFGGVGLLDIAGMPRIVLKSIDIGAYEVKDDTVFHDSFE